MNAGQKLIYRLLKVTNSTNEPPITQEEFMSLYFDQMAELEKAGYFVNKQAEYDFMRMQHLGGICDHCGAQWKKIEVDQKTAGGRTIAQFEYFLPACNCYPKCDFCGGVLYVEVKEGIMGCRNCFTEKAYPRCRKLIYKRQKSGRTAADPKPARCSGYMAPRIGGFECTECGRKVSSLKYQAIQ